MTDIVENLEILAGLKDAPGFNPTAMDYFAAAHQALKAIQELRTEITRTLTMADNTAKNNEKLLTLVGNLQTDLGHMVNFAAVQGIDLLDNHHADASMEAWRALPKHLQDFVIEKTEALEQEANLP